MQNKIEKFIKPSLKRKLREEEEEDSSVNETPSKRLKENALPLSNLISSNSSVSLNSEQMDKIEKNKRLALEKLELTKKKKLLEQLTGKLDSSWNEILRNEFEKPYFQQLLSFLVKEYQEETIYPPAELVLEAFNQCSLANLKVVILGQDPYHGERQAHGLAFSVQKGITIPASLKNIFQEIQANISDFEIPDHGCLVSWCKQGVFLLNTCLTVKAKQPASHSTKGWETFTDCVIKTIAKEKKNVVFLLWGSHAQSKKSIIQFYSKNNHFILQAAHPSPFSVHKGFFGCKHFSETNRLLKNSNQDPIHWQLPSKNQINEVDSSQFEKQIEKQEEKK